MTDITDAQQFLAWQSRGSHIQGDHKHHAGDKATYIRPQVGRDTRKQYRDKALSIRHRERRMQHWTRTKQNIDQIWNKTKEETLKKREINHNHKMEQKHTANHNTPTEIISRVLHLSKHLFLMRMYQKVLNSFLKVKNSFPYKA